MKRQKFGPSATKSKQSVSKGPRSEVRGNSDTALMLSGTSDHATPEAPVDFGSINLSDNIESIDSHKNQETISISKGKKVWKKNTKLPSTATAAGGTDITQPKAWAPRLTISEQNLFETSEIPKVAQKRQSYSDIVKNNQAAKSTALKLPMVDTIKLTNAEDKPHVSAVQKNNLSFVDKVFTKEVLTNVNSLRTKALLDEVNVVSTLSSSDPSDFVSDVGGAYDQKKRVFPLQSPLDKNSCGGKSVSKSEGISPNLSAENKPPTEANENTTEEGNLTLTITSGIPSKIKHEPSPPSVRSAKSKESFKRPSNSNTSPLSEEIEISTHTAIPLVRISSKTESLKSVEEISAYDTAEEGDNLESNEDSLVHDSVEEPAARRKTGNLVDDISMALKIGSSISRFEGVNQASSISNANDCSTPVKMSISNESETVNSASSADKLQSTLASSSSAETGCEAKYKCPVSPAIEAGCNTVTECDSTVNTSSSLVCTLPSPELEPKSKSKSRPMSLNFHTLPRLGSNVSVESDNFHNLRRNESLSSLRDHAGSQGGCSRVDFFKNNRIITVPRIVTSHFSHVTSIDRETTMNDLRNSIDQLPAHAHEAIRQNLKVIEQYPAYLPLSDSWCMFISRSPIQTNKKTSMHRKGFEDSQIMLFESSNVFDLCGYWKTYKTIVNPDGHGPVVLLGGLRHDKEAAASIYGLNKHGDNLLFFRKHIRPAWEDPRNAEGGSIRLSEMTSTVFENVFENLIFGAAGMSLEGDTKARLETLGYNHSDPEDLGIIAGIYASRRKVKGSAASGRMASPGPDLFRVGIWVSGSKGPFSPVPDKWASALFTVVQNYLNLSPGQAKFTPYTKHK